MKAVSCLEISTIRTLLVEDFPSFRAFVRSMLAENPLLCPICEASDGVEAIAKARELRPDLILMDIGLPQLNGLETARRIRELVPSAKIVFLTQESDIDVVQEALGIGARGFIAKGQAGTELLAGLELVLQGEPFVSSELRGKLRSEMSVSC
jgi:DNA-binding NarL/FixJ family response regulator